MSWLGFLNQIYLSIRCNFRLVHFLQTLGVLTSNCTAFPCSVVTKTWSQERSELNIACALHVKRRAQEQKCVNDFCDVELEGYWTAALSRSSFPSWAVWLPLQRVLWVTLMSLPALAGQNSADPRFFLFWDLQIWVWYHCKHPNIGVTVLLLSLPRLQMAYMQLLSHSVTPELFFPVFCLCILSLINRLHLCCLGCGS